MHFCVNRYAKLSAQLARYLPQWKQLWQTLGEYKIFRPWLTKCCRQWIPSIPGGVDAPATYTHAISVVLALVTSVNLVCVLWSVHLHWLLILQSRLMHRRHRRLEVAVRLSCRQCLVEVAWMHGCGLTVALLSLRVCCRPLEVSVAQKVSHCCQQSHYHLHCHSSSLYSCG